jgi:ribosomal protein L37AE/L43A
MIKRLTRKALLRAKQRALNSGLPLLKLCPFCQYTARVRRVRGGLIAWCRECKARGPMAPSAGNGGVLDSHIVLKLKAIMLWNKRIADTPEEEPPT